MFKLKYITNLCRPARMYFYVNVVILILILFQNSTVASDILCLGNYECYVENKWVSLFSNGIYIAFWTFVFNLMCRQGYTNFAWFLFLFPFILVAIYFILVLGLTHKSNRLEGLSSNQRNNNAANNNANNNARNSANNTPVNSSNAGNSEYARQQRENERQRNQNSQNDVWRLS